MRTKNFFKGLAVAAIALVGAFATSCSEENLNVNATGTPVVLPDGKATVVITVVDLGDMGVGATVKYSEVKDVTTGSHTFACPSFTGSDEYVIPADQSITVPALEKGQFLSIPVTFYVVKFTSTYATIAETEVTDWSSYTDGSEVVSTKDYKNESNYGVEYTLTCEDATGWVSYEEVATARATSENEIINSYVKSLIGLEESEWNQTYEFILAPWAQTKVTKSCEYYTVRKSFTYGETTKTYTLKNISSNWLEIDEPTAIEGHAHAYDHYQEHGFDMNAGGGVSESI